MNSSSTRTLPTQQQAAPQAAQALGADYDVSKFSTSLQGGTPLIRVQRELRRPPHTEEITPRRDVGVFFEVVSVIGVELRQDLADLLRNSL